MHDLVRPVRDLLVTLPDRIKVAWYRLRAWSDRVFLRFIDRYLARRDEERAPTLLDFDELPVLYDFADFTVVPGDSDADSGILGGWKWAPPIAYDDTDVL